MFDFLKYVRVKPEEPRLLYLTEDGKLSSEKPPKRIIKLLPGQNMEIYGKAMLLLKGNPGAYSVEYKYVPDAFGGHSAPNNTLAFPVDGKIVSIRLFENPWTGYIHFSIQTTEDCPITRSFLYETVSVDDGEDDALLVLMREKVREALDRRIRERDNQLLDALDRAIIANSVEQSWA